MSSHQCTQEPPGNYGMEVTRVFAKGFLFKQAKGRVDWAAFFESIVAHMEAGKLQSKKQRWAVFHSRSPATMLGSSSKLPSPKCKQSGVDMDDCNTSGRWLMPMPVKLDFFHLDSIFQYVAAKHETALHELDQASTKLEAKKANLHRNEGALDLIASLTQQLEDAKSSLKQLASLDDTNQLEVQKIKVTNLQTAIDTISAGF